MEINIQNLSKKFGKKYALDNISLSIGTGMFGLLGRNGAGKTTLMRILATLSVKTTGCIVINDVPIEHTKEIRKMIGYLPQDFSIYPHMTVWQAMDYLGMLSELSKNERMERIPRLLEQVNLIENRSTKIKALSGGMKRRLGIAQALLHNPQVLIVDEPTAGLDPEERIHFRNLLCEIAHKHIVILSTHIVGDIESTCKYTAILDRGQILFHSTINKLAEQATGKVYTMDIAADEISVAKQNFHILNMQVNSQTTNLRILSDYKPADNAIPCNPTVEDGYMEVLRKSEGGGFQ